MLEILRGGWRAASDTLALAYGDVHVWRAGLALPERHVRELRALLSEDERRRAEAFVRPRDARRFTVARGQLRRVLGLYTRVDPAELLFSYGEYEKPYLSPELSRDAALGVLDLHFNVSHSNDLALFAVARGREVGIDVEEVRLGLAWEQIAAGNFSPREFMELRQLPESQRLRAFFRCWTSKEAYVKARGEGLVHPLEEFDVSVRPDRPAALLSSRSEPSAVERWGLEDVDAGAAYVAALAIENRGQRRAA